MGEWRATKAGIVGAVHRREAVGEVFALHCWIETRDVLLFEDSCI